jgi:hypothetical protein
VYYANFFLLQNFKVQNAGVVIRMEKMDQSQGVIWHVLVITNKYVVDFMQIQYIKHHQRFVQVS